MSDQLNTLQQAIEKRASNRLKNDLGEIANQLKNVKLLYPYNGSSLSYEEFPKLSYEESKQAKGTMGSLLSAIIPMPGNNSPVSLQGEYIKALYQYWLPYYVAEETAAFIDRVDEVDSLMKEVSDLKNR